MSRPKMPGLDPIDNPEEAQSLLRQIVDEYRKRGFFNPARVPVPLDDRARFVDERGPEEFAMAMIEVLRADDSLAQAVLRLKVGPPEYLAPSWSDDEIERAIDEAEQNPPLVGDDDPPDASDEDWNLILIQEFIRNTDLASFLLPPGRPRRRQSPTKRLRRKKKGNKP